MNFNPALIVSLFILGTCFGSFAVASVWRFRAKFLAFDKKHSQPVDEGEYKRLKSLSKTSIMHDYSRCLSCSYKLKWYDMIPLVSWVILGGKCRKCRKPIGYLEPSVELALGLFFVLSFAFWPVSVFGAIEITHFILWLIAGVTLAMIFIYDMKWLEIPTILNYVLVGLGVVYSLLVIIHSSDTMATVVSILGSVLILSGLYLAIYYVSSKKWIGFGDILLGFGLALILADWRLAYVALFAANFIGCIVVLPEMFAGKLKRTSRIPFGPLLIVGFSIAGLFGGRIINYVLFGTF